MAAAAPGLAAANSFRGQRGTDERSVFADGVHGINRTGGREAAAANRSTQDREQGRQRHAINADGKQQDVGKRVHRGFNKLARLRAARKSFSTPAKFFSAME